MLEQLDGDVVGRWRVDVEPHLDATWRRLSGRASTGLEVTPDEMELIEVGIERLLAPYVLRKDTPRDDWPAGTRTVQILRYTMPAPDANAESQ